MKPIKPKKETVRQGGTVIKDKTGKVLSRPAFGKPKKQGAAKKGEPQKKE